MRKVMNEIIEVLKNALYETACNRRISGNDKEIFEGLLCVWDDVFIKEVIFASSYLLIEELLLGDLSDGLRSKLKKTYDFLKKHYEEEDGQNNVKIGLINKTPNKGSRC